MNFVKIISILFKFFIFVVGVYGVAENRYYAKDKVAMFCYYTTISNMICMTLALIWAVILISGRKLNSFRYYSAVKGGSVIMIIVTHIIFHFLLRPNMKEVNAEFFTTGHFNLILHYIVPLATLFDYLLFDQKGNFKYVYIFSWIGVPLLYVPFAYTRVYLTGMFDKGLGNKYPYFFLDYETLGFPKMIALIAVLILFFVILSVCLVFVDHLLAKFFKNSDDDKDKKD